MIIDKSYKLKEYIQALYDVSEVSLLLVQMESESSLMGEMQKFIAGQDEIEYFGVVLEFSSHGNFLKRLYFLFLSRISIYRIKRYLIRLGIKVDSSYGVYPSVLTPAIIFELGKQSEVYINEYILPPISSGFSGRLRELIKKLIKFHPSLGGLLIIAKREL